MHMVVDIFKHDEAVGTGRLDVRLTVERRRRWSAEEKGRIVAESFAPGAVASEVARRHEISPQHLFQWRTAARTGRLVVPLAEGMSFAPVVVVERPTRAPGPERGGLDVEVAGATIRVGVGADLDLLAAVVRALKAAA